MNPMLERRLLASSLRGMAWVAALAAFWVGWSVVRGPEREASVPSLSVADLPPRSHTWADPPVPPPGLPVAAAAQFKLLLLRDAQGSVHALYWPLADGRPSLPTGGSALGPGLPCEDIAPDFQQQDIACRQASAGFEFALRHRWSLRGDALSPGTPALPRAAGQEQNGEWVWPAPAPR